MEILNLGDLLSIYQQGEQTYNLTDQLKKDNRIRVHLNGGVGSMRALLVSAVYKELPRVHVVVLSDKESGAYFANDIENIFGEKDANFHKKNVLFYPTSYKRPYEMEKVDSNNALSRTEVLKRLGSTTRKTIIVTYPEALCERVVSKNYMEKRTMRLKRDQEASLDTISDLLLEYEFERVDFVAEPGQFSVRGGILDVFSFTNDYPYRIEFTGDEVESIRSFDPVSQLSVDHLDHITIVPNVQHREIEEERQSFLSYIPQNAVLWFEDAGFSDEQIEKEFQRAVKAYDQLREDSDKLEPEQLFITPSVFNRDITGHSLIEFGTRKHFEASLELNYHIKPQPSFNKNFDLLIDELIENSKNRIKNLILSDKASQVERIHTIIDDIKKNREIAHEINYTTLNDTLHEGFIDKDNKIACYTDHQIFDRYHKFRLKERFASKQAITLKELYDLKPGDYVTHIDHGIGIFDGLEKIDNNGKKQEAIRLIYKNSDLLYVSIHSLHRISKFVGKEGTEPSLHRLGSNAWQNLKNRTKKKVKDIAKDLIKLYAKRKATEGYDFTPDNYMQHELEASFIYEDTPDQVKSTADVKKDMEAAHPMDRLVCGDVGFGKTEIAIRAAFKAVSDSKQVAVLVPTTILTLQHYNTFKERLDEFPVTIDYLNRFKSQKQQKETLKALEEGKIDILVGTHRLVSKDLKFKDLGLMIVDEEQKFGVATKEKLKQIKVNVDTLTLTATPIPRTLQFSLMGARDLSIINTPPANRYPVQTELHSFNTELIRDAVSYETERGGQVFFVHNRVQNINEVATMIKKLLPGVKVAVGHGQMEGKTLEKVMVDFIRGTYDVLVATTIIESGLDISNVNTMIINDAHKFGLSDLHQLRGRVGRSNKKAFCYLLAPPLSTLTSDARKRLKALEEFSDLGSGFNIAMRDLDIRGAGNILGAEQSGFIADVGFETYHKILDEAVSELKSGEFKELYKDEQLPEFVKECQIETDLAILIPDDYVTNIQERLSLYKELDNIESEERLQQFRQELIDRFGDLPPQTEELINAIRMRWIAREVGFEKIYLKNERMIGYFPSNQDSPYFQSPQFTAILQYLKTHYKSCKMREKNSKLSVVFRDVKTIAEAIVVLKELSIKTEEVV
ncbi:MAG: transcription-repair coupling factor [Bacteroidales bacterium]|nr:transcription-repair coupling factor [Bacteroidales bacterium]